jgi:hypothetical protein
MTPLEQFLDDERLSEMVELVDEGVDYVFMLEPADWTALSNAWDSKDTEWRSNIAYFAGFRNLDVSKEILMKAVNDEEPEVFEEALLALHQSITEQLDGVDEEDIDEELLLSDVEKTQVLNALNATDEDFKTYPEYEELVALMQP